MRAASRPGPAWADDRRGDDRSGRGGGGSGDGSNCHEAADTAAGRFVPARHFDAIENLPNWRNWAPRSSLVYDLFGNAKTALKFSLNKYNLARTTGIANTYTSTSRMPKISRRSQFDGRPV